MAKKTKKTEEITKKFGDERRKALDDALKNIEKDFGRAESSSYEFRLAGFGYCSWCRWLS